MELKRYFALARRWLWLGILGLALGAAAGYFFSASQTPIYQASTRFVILRAAQGSTADYYSYLDSRQLAQTYIQLLTTDKVLRAASEELGYAVNAKQASAQQVGDTQFVQLTVTDADPQRTVDIANVLVSVLIAQNEELQSVRYNASEKNLQDQITQVQSQISTLQTRINEISAATVQDQLTQVQAQIEKLQEQVAALQNDIAVLQKLRYPTAEQQAELIDKQAQLAQLQPLLALYQQVYTNLVVLGQPVDQGVNTSAGLNQLQTTLNLYQNIYVSLLNNLEQVRLAKAQNTPNVVQVEPAVAPKLPISPRPLQTSALAGAVGLMLAAGIAFLIEYLDDTLKTMEDVEQALGLPVVGYIAQIQYEPGSEESLYVIRQPRSPVSEAFRLLRANLEFAGVDRPIRRLLVTSAAPGDGKTTISANLAAIAAQGGKRVTLIDTDLRRPRIHRFLGLSNKLGLTDLFRSDVAVNLVAQKIDVQTGTTAVLTSGSLPPNPAELLGSARMEQILQEVGRDADLVILDSPPAIVADVQVLAAKVDAVILVIHPGHTHVDSARATLEMLNRAGARVVGVVLNRIPRDRADYYGGYRHYSPYHSGYRYYAYSGEERGNGKHSRINRLTRKLMPFNGNGRRKTEADAAAEEDSVLKL
ncbi:MAG: polysaccharide biosynthesis tyrosine autokinase [Anaerolineales bacterium]|nr:polysaccharide biosynthesis tyrosine autokinase [Anaerolineales bacterium]